MGMQNDSHFGKSITVSYKFQHSSYHKTQKFHLFKRNENLYQHKDLYLIIHSSIIHCSSGYLLHTFVKRIEMYILKGQILLSR